MSSRTRSRRPASIGSNQSSRRWTAVPASDCRARDFVLLLLMAWSPPARKRRHRLGFNHPETTPPAIPTTPRTAPKTPPPDFFPTLHVYQLGEGLNSRLIQPDRIQPNDVVNAEIFIRVVALDVIVPDVVDLFP